MIEIRDATIVQSRFDNDLATEHTLNGAVEGIRFPNRKKVLFIDR